MATPAPIRRKRNFNIKSLQLDVSQPPPAPQPAPIPTRLAPPPAVGGAKRKPPMMDLSKSKAKDAPPAASESPNIVTLAASPSSAPATGSLSAAPKSNYHSKLSEQLATLDMDSEKKLDLKNEDLKELAELGQGNSGSVKKAMHLPTETIMAKKVVLIDAKPAIRKQILRELQIMHDCHSEHIISFYGAFVLDPNVCICMEFMDRGSLDRVYKKCGAIEIGIVGKVAHAVLEGLTYLYNTHRIIHRDIKPSNILLNSEGQIKICDFGVSGELINSIADTFVGTSIYMSPERIQGAQYTVKSDVWSLGIALIELALGRFPFADSDSDDSDLEDLETTMSPARPGSVHIPRPGAISMSLADKKKERRKSKGVSLQGGGMTMSIFELLQHVVNEPAPKLTPEEKFPAESRAFVDSCLLKDPVERPTPKDLLEHAWIVQSSKADIDVKAWANTLP